MTPIALSDAQMPAVFAASCPLDRDRRSPFLEACDREIANLPPALRGDGSIHASSIRRSLP